MPPCLSNISDRRLTKIRDISKKRVNINLSENTTQLIESGRSFSTSVETLSLVARPRFQSEGSSAADRYGTPCLFVCYNSVSPRDNNTSMFVTPPPNSFMSSSDMSDTAGHKPDEKKQEGQEGLWHLGVPRMNCV